VTKSSA